MGSRTCGTSSALLLTCVTYEYTFWFQGSKLENTDSVEHSSSNNHRDKSQDKSLSVSLSLTSGHPTSSKSSDSKSTPSPSNLIVTSVYCSCPVDVNLVCVVGTTLSPPVLSSPTDIRGSHLTVVVSVTLRPCRYFSDSYVYYESLNRELKTKPINECRCDERLNLELRNLHVSRVLRWSRNWNT